MLNKNLQDSDLATMVAKLFFFSIYISNKVLKTVLFSRILVFCCFNRNFIFSTVFRSEFAIVVAVQLRTSPSFLRCVSKNM